MTDIGVVKLAVIFEFLDPLPPVTVELSPPSKHRKNQKSHMYWWYLAQQTQGHGGYSRIRGNDSSKSTYNRLQTVEGMLWIAEALGEDPERLREAVTASLAYDRKNARARCAAFREIIPWERIAELIHDPQGWLIDPALKPFMSWYKGWPEIKDQTAFKKTLNMEIG